MTFPVASSRIDATSFAWSTTQRPSPEMRPATWLSGSLPLSSVTGSDTGATTRTETAGVTLGRTPGDRGVRTR